jgi:heptosyltransferase-2
VKILVRATNWVGDAVMAIPALEALRAREPRAEITIAAREAVADLYRGQDFVDRVVSLGGSKSARRESAICRDAIGDDRFDFGLALPNSFASAWFLARSNARERIGYARDGRRWLLTRPVARPRADEIPAHETYYYLELLRRAGWIEKLPVVERVRLRVDAEDAARAREKLRSLGAGEFAVALAAGASYGAAKCWAAERYAAVADRLAEEMGANIVLFGTAAEREIGARIAGAMRRPAINLIGQTSARELAALLAACRLFLGNDSGAMHVAAAVGLPVVAVFGSTDPDGTAPLALRRTLVRRPVSCSPCFLRYCPVDHRCMTRISVEDVYQATRLQIEDRQADGKR